MKKVLAIILAVLGSFTAVKAGHIAGGEMYYKYKGPGASPNTDRFEITLRLFRECSAGGPNVADMPDTVMVGIFARNTINTYSLHSDFIVLRNGPIQSMSVTPGAYPCIVPPPNVCYQVGYFTTTKDLPRNQFGYLVSFQTCCRSTGILNMQVQSLPTGSTGEGATYVGNIPGLGSAPAPDRNSSPEFSLKDTAVVCQNSPFTLDFGAVDPDPTDSLVYTFCSAFNRGIAVNSSNIVPSTPPYSFIGYTGGFNGAKPLGPNVNIDRKTGLISGIAPGAGKYVINVCIDEYRNGVKISEHRKDFTLRVESCQIADAALQPGYITCDGFTLSFQNLTTSSLIQSWYWDFGVPGMTADTSNLEKPTFTFPDTGTFTLKLIVNKNGQCNDSATATVKVYPGFFPAFTATGGCIDHPVQFNDATTTKYGAVTGWRWNFADETTDDDSALAQNPQWKYSTTGIKKVRLIVGNTMGCTDTTFSDVEVFDKPPLDMPFRDTLICSVDTLQLAAVGTGSFSWLPNYNILNAGTATPLVWPKTTTVYNVTLNDRGCINTDSIKVRVVDFVTLSPPIDTTVCLTDSLILRPVTDGLKFVWSPAATLDNPTKKNPRAIPIDVVTPYSVTASIGKCDATATVIVRTVPYPTVNAGPDVTICYDDTVQINGSIIAAAFNWTPANTLINANTLNPLAFPLFTTRYILTATDVLGCPKPSRDTVQVTVRPKINAFAGNDTSIVVGQPLQLNGSGSMMYTWSPPTGLNKTNIANPVAVLNDHMTYVMRAYTPENCEGYDTINIFVFKTKPDIFVPNAFTPGKKQNNLFRPAATPGISKLEFFMVYNRWGQLVFSTNEIGRGWDGNLAGKPQDTGTFVWIVQGSDFTGKKVFKKGTMVLIR